MTKPIMRPILAAAAAALALAVPGAAQASTLDGLSGCPGDTTTAAFARWLDPGQYVQAPDGGFERGGVGWTFAGGAGVVAGNEPFGIDGGGTRSLRIPAGGSAITPATCVGIGSPTLRFLARSGGLLPLQVSVRLAGTGLWLPVLVPVLATGSWQPTLPLPFLANALALPTSTGTTHVQFRFAAVGAAWSVDDVDVDPYKWK